MDFEVDLFHKKKIENNEVDSSSSLLIIYGNLNIFFIRSLHDSEIVSTSIINHTIYFINFKILDAVKNTRLDIQML